MEPTPLTMLQLGCQPRQFAPCSVVHARGELVLASDGVGVARRVRRRQYNLDVANLEARWDDIQVETHLLHDAYGQLDGLVGAVGHLRL
jgi:hypothetical protein